LHSLAAWKDNWVVSDWKKSEQGKLEWSNGGYYGDDVADKGLFTSEDARFYAFSAKLPQEFSNKEKVRSYCMHLILFNDL
jgi:calreticulin